MSGLADDSVVLDIEQGFSNESLHEIIVQAEEEFTELGWSGPEAFSLAVTLFIGTRMGELEARELSHVQPAIDVVTTKINQHLATSEDNRPA